MSAVAQRLITAEEFLLLPPTEMRRELVRGEIVETMPPICNIGSVSFIL